MQLQQQSIDDAELAVVLGRMKDKFQNTLKTLQTFQAMNSERIFNTGWFFFWHVNCTCACYVILEEHVALLLFLFILL